MARVAGMSVLLRQLLSLQDAGIDEVVIEGLDPGQFPADPRLTLKLLPVPSTRMEEARGGKELSARMGLVWHRLLPKRLVQIGYADDIEAAVLEGDEFVLPTADPQSRRLAEDRLFQSLLKATDGLISRTINRPISLRVTRSLIDTSLTPNQMTIVAALFGVAAIAVVAVGGAPWLVTGALLLQVQSILDGCDGEISRLKYIRSRVGEWLDQIVDDFVNVGFFAATGWALYKAGWTLALPLAIVGTACHVIYQAALYIALITRGGGSGSVASIRWSGQLDPHASNGGETLPSLFKTVKETLEMAGRRDFFTFLYLPTALVGLPQIAFCWGALIFFLSGTLSSLLWLLHGGPRAAPRSS